MKKKDTRISELYSALNKENCTWRGKRLDTANTNDVVPKIDKQAFISDISYAYNLNKLQHIAFNIIATKMLKRWISQQIDNTNVKNVKIDIGKIDSEDLSNQICMVLVGEGGTGKSRVINAIDALFLSWGRPNSLVKAAPTGKAATLINGRTLASVLIRLRHSKSSTNDFLVSCIIIDEMSMMTLKDLHDLDVHLRRITGLKTVFGGISIILCGDFLQLPPAGGRPLYKKPIDKINELIDDFSNNKKCGERKLQEKEDIVENLLDLDKNISTHTNENNKNLLVKSNNKFHLLMK